MWNYTDKLMDHFLNPRNIGEVENPDGEATIGNMNCGDALKISFKLDKNNRIEDVKFKTFGCGSAIASSSVLTEMVKGMTLDEAKKITNEEIVDALGGIPKEKIHCSVMGSDALHKAIANYRGEDYDKAFEGTIICQCFNITEEKIRKTAEENNLHNLEEITDYTKAGGACEKCHDQIKDILNDLWGTAEQGNDKQEEEKDSSKELNFTQKVLKIQQVIDSEIKPILHQHGGSLEFVDLEGDVVFVKLKGKCNACKGANSTLKGIVEQKLKENISKKITVAESK